MDEPAIERAFAAAQFGTYQWRLLIIAGVGWMTDGMEMYVMALILPLLASEMELSADALGMMGGGVFMGMGAGAYFWGAVADHYGRRPAYGGALLTSLVFGFTSAASPGFGGLMASRILFGVGVGGFLPVSTTMLVESGPATAHASNIVAMCCLFTLGACFEALLGWLILPTLGWRWLVAISALVRRPPSPVPLPSPPPLPRRRLPLTPHLRAQPLLPAFFAFFLLLETPAWLASRGRYEAARRQVERILAINGGGASARGADAAEAGAAGKTTAPKAGKAPEKAAAAPGAAADAEGGRGACERATSGFVELCTVHARLTALVCYMWFAVSFTYYGCVFVLPTWLAGQSEANGYLGVVLSAAAELPGNVLAGYCCDRVGRERTLLGSFAFTAASALSCGVVAQYSSWRWVLAAACLVKLSVAASFCAMYIYTSEAFPTKVRSEGLGLGSVFMRTAGCLTPLVGELLIDGVSAFATFSVYALATIIAAACAALLPRDPASQFGPSERTSLIAK